MKISVITVAYNMAATIEATIQSVADQRYADVEHIVVDGASTDGTCLILARHSDKLAHSISERDRGIYDAMNKGIALATGDVIGFLNADDTFADPYVLESVAAALRDDTVDACYADLLYFNGGMPTRRYDSSRFSPGKLAWGFMPAHPTLYVRRRVFEHYGGFSLNYRIAADYEFVARVLGRGQCRAVYVPKVWVHMSVGGISTRGFKSSWVLNKEIVRACRQNGISTNLLMVLSKAPIKLLELFRH